MRVRVEDLVKTYPPRDGPVVAVLRDVSLAVGDAEFVAILEPCRCRGRASSGRRGSRPSSAGDLMLTGRLIAGLAVLCLLGLASTLGAPGPRGVARALAGRRALARGGSGLSGAGRPVC